jgi:6-phosphogluconolactonase (cycloisomerase 2 family)
VAESNTNRVALYASVGPELTHYEVDVEGGALARRATITLPANVHYAWPHASGRILYVASSDSASGIGGVVGTKHHVTALRVDPASGALSPHGEPIPLPTRPIHMTLDIPSEHILVAFSNPSGLQVYRINSDMTPGAQVAQSEPIDPGIYGHQVRVTLDNRKVILVTRGHDAAGGKPEEPGALKVFDFRDGLLTNEVSVAPNGGYGFGPRHLDFHPTKPWVYVSLERQNRLDMFALDRLPSPASGGGRGGGALSAEPLFRKGTLADPGTSRGRQAVGTVKLHRSGRFAYVANRASSADQAGVFVGGENNLAVFAIDPATGEPSLIQHVDTRGIHCRNFHIDPSGRLLVASHITGLPVKDGDATRFLPACLSLFRIGGDGRLDFVGKYDVEVGDRQMFWMGMVAL